MLRRSLTGSLRAVSMVSSFKERVGERTARNNERTGVNASPSPNRPIPPNLHEEVRPPPPELDRDVDLYATGLELNDPDINFELLLQPRPSTCLHPLFTLPVSVRRKIYSYCIPPNGRKVTLSPHFATKACFEDQYFISPWDLLDPVSGATSASRIMRDELMTYFWTEFHFHVTLHPFSGPKFSPLSHVWLLEFLDKVQHLTLETDLTRFGGSPLKYAPQFGYDMEKMESLLVGIVTGLLKNRDGATMAELHLMCRRYRGDRPINDSDLYDCGPGVPYCPEETAYLCDALCGLRGRLQCLRISGFVESYTELLLCSVFGSGEALPDFLIPMDDAWPPLPGSSARRFKYRPSSTATCPDYRLKLSRSRSFSEDMHKEMLKFGSPDYARSFSTADDNQSLVGDDSLPKNHFASADDNQTMANEDTQPTTPEWEDSSPLPENLRRYRSSLTPPTRSKNGQPVPEHLQGYQSSLPRLPSASNHLDKGQSVLGHLKGYQSSLPRLPSSSLLNEGRPVPENVKHFNYSLPRLPSSGYSRDRQPATHTLRRSQVHPPLLSSNPPTNNLSTIRNGRWSPVQLPLPLPTFDRSSGGQFAAQIQRSQVLSPIPSVITSTDRQSTTSNSRRPQAASPLLPLPSILASPRPDHVQATSEYFNKSQDVLPPLPSPMFSNNRHSSANTVKTSQTLPPLPSYSEAVEDQQALDSDPALEYSYPNGSLMFHGEEIVKTTTVDITREPRTHTLSPPIAITMQPSTPIQSPRLLPIPQRTSPPRSPNTMNDLNEQDPAFLRTLNALRSVESVPKTTRNFRASLVPVSNSGNMENADVPERCASSLSQTKSEGQKHRYQRFVDKLRRHS